MLTTTEKSLERIEAQLDKLTKILVGNGGVGLAEKVRILEHKHESQENKAKDRRKLLYVVVALLSFDNILTIGKNVLKWLGG